MPGSCLLGYRCRGLPDECCRLPYKRLQRDINIVVEFNMLAVTAPFE